MKGKIAVERIKRLMAERNMKASELASRCGWIDSKTSKILNGRQTITIDDLEAIGDALKINPAALISLNMRDVTDYDKEIIPLNKIFDDVYAVGDDEGVLTDLLEHEMNATISQYLPIKDAGRTIRTYIKTKRMKNGEADIVTIPRVLITDNNIGQLFANELTVGYWFSESREEVYLALHYMIDESSLYRQLYREQDRIRTYSTILMFKEFFKSDRGEMELGNSLEAKKYNVGTIICKKYELKKAYSEEELKQDLIDYYNYYNSSLNSIVAKMQHEIMMREMRENVCDYSFVTKDANITNIEISSRSEKHTAIPIPMRSDKKHIESVFKREKYKCELNDRHDTFIDNNGVPYMEPYRLIPLTVQSEFGKSLNIEENLCCLCPMCRAKIEHAQDSEKQEMLMKLYLKHKEPLKRAGIEVSPLQLFKLYGMG